MTEHLLLRAQTVPRAPEEVFAFFGDAWNLEVITPSWLRFRILDAPAALVQGSLLRYRLHLLGIPIRWRTEIVEWRPPHLFVDRQLAGPYPLWIHTHRFTPVEGGTEVRDEVRYRVPGGPLEALVDRIFVRPRLEAIFDYRAARIAELLHPPA